MRWVELKGEESDAWGAGLGERRSIPKTGDDEYAAGGVQGAEQSAAREHRVYCAEKQQHQAIGETVGASGYAGIGGQLCEECMQSAGDSHQHT